MDRHFTVSGFVVHQGRVALHWHRKNQMWLPAGGHIEANEDPLTAVLREVREEYDLDAEPLALAPRVGYLGGPVQIEPPFTILVEHIAPEHEHIDMIYFLRLRSGYPGTSEDPASPIHWFDASELRRGAALVDGGVDTPFEPDVLALGLEALRLDALPETRTHALPPVLAKAGH